MSYPTMKSFSKLYPIFISKFEELIPLDEDMNVVDKMNHVITYLNDVGKLNDNVVRQWNTVMKWVMEDGLTESLEHKIDSLIVEGTFDDILHQVLNDKVVGDINEKIENVSTHLAQTTTELTNKMDKDTVDIGINQINKNKGLIDETYISDTLKQQITGNTPIHATPADHSITTNKLAFNPVLGIPSKNLFNKETANVGYYVQSSSGNLVANAEYFASDYILVEPNTEYVRQPRVDLMAFYDENKTYISGLGYGEPANFITPSNAKYVRVSGYLTELDTYQLEKGSTPTDYVPFGVKLNGDKIISLDSNKITPLDGAKVKPKTISSDRFTDFVVGKNLFNKNTVTTGKVVSSSTGILNDNVDYFTSDYILVEPNTEYVRQPRVDTLAFFDENKTYISGLGYDATLNFTTPVNARYVRLSALLTELDSYQLEKGSTSTDYEEYYYTFKYLKNDVELNPIKSNNIYTFNDAWVAWNDGEKFPIAFYGDSTTAGVGTSGYTVNNVVGTDFIVNTSYAKILEDKLREITNNDVLRVYNGGFSGETAEFGSQNIEAEFSGTAAYADVKMIGIGFGINDRTFELETGGLNKSQKESRERFKTYIAQMIDWCFANGIQPFLLTTQAVLAPAPNYSYSPLSTQIHANIIANEVKHDLSLEYDIPLIDIHAATENFLLYSSHSFDEIMSDKTHFEDVGHQFEAGVMVKEITPITTTFDGNAKIDFTTQNIYSDVVTRDNITMGTTPEGFKTYANFVKADSVDSLILKAFVFVDGKNKLTLKACKTDLTSLTYVKVNGVATTLDTLEKTITQLDLGLHTLEVWSGESDMVDFKGFNVE